MKQRRKAPKLTISLESIVVTGAVALAITACGGGGSAGAPSAPASYIPSPTGSVSADFVTGSTPRFFLGSNGTQILGNATSSVQSAGAITAVGTYSLSGSPAVVQEISGDANYAMGRWVWGTVYNNSTQIGVLDASHSSAYMAWHYVLVNKPATWPANVASMTCDSGVFTQPNITGAVSASSAIPTTTGVVNSLSFDGTSRITMGMALTTTHGVYSNTSTYTLTNLAGSETSISGTGGLSASSYTLFSDGGGGAIRISGYYNSTLPNGGVYYGAFSFKCQ